MTKAFPEIPKIRYEGPKSKNPLAFKYYDADEVELIKTRLRSVERERLNTIFSSVEKANNILGRQALQSQRVMDEMFDEPRGGHAAD